MRIINKWIQDAFMAALNNKDLSSKEVNLLSYQLGCIAFLTYTNNRNYFAISNIEEWLTICGEQKNLGKAEEFNSEDIKIDLESLVNISVTLGFLSYQNGVLKFKNKTIKDYFAIFYCASSSLNPYILENTPQDLWRLWAKVDINLPDTLIRYMEDNLTDQSKEDAFSALYEIGNKRVRNLLIQTLKNRKSKIRSEAAGLLGKLNETKAVEILIDTLSDPDAQVRISSAEALGEIGDKKAVAALLNSLKDSNAEVIRAAVYALGYIGDKSAIVSLIPLLENESLAYSVAISLGNLKDEKGTEPLITKLNTNSEETQYWVINALGKIGDKKAIEPLSELFLKTQNSRILSALAWALGELGETRVFEYLIKDLLDASKGLDPQNPFKGENAADALGDLKDKRAVPYLISSLSNVSWFFRQKIVEALGKIKDPTSKDALSKMLLDKDPDVRASALKALEEFDNYSN